MRRQAKIARLARVLIIACALLITGISPAPSELSLAQGTSRSFPETGKSIKGKFLQYWDAHGGLAQQGYPISNEMQEASETDGRTYTVQYFERAVFELHPENEPPYDVLLQLLGVFYYERKYSTAQPTEIPNTEPGSILFKETGQRLGGLFLQYWNTHGGLMQQGYPISDEFIEKNDLDGKTYRVQYFERAVFEMHPENKPPYNVLLSQLGAFRYRAKYGDSPGPTPTAAAPSARTWVTSHNAIPQPNLPKPAQGATYIDPSFGTRITRITNAASAKYEGIVPEYSKRQAWNSNESLLLLRTGDGDAQLYDGTTYQYEKLLPKISGEDVFWHPTNPSLILYNPDNTLYSYDVTTDKEMVIASFSEYTWANTRGEGNLSRDGRWYAVVGQIYNSGSGETTMKDIVVFDLTTRKVAAKLALPAQLDDFDWVSISPLGNYVVVDYATTETGRWHGVEVYDRNMKFLWQKPLGAGHSDLTVDASGDEALVMDVYDGDTNRTYIRKFRLSDGKETTLLEFSWDFDSHTSCRNEQRTGWCFISTFDGEGRLSDSAQSWLPFEDEVFALKLDGSGEVQRIAHHHSRRFSPAAPDRDNSVYWSEPHATVSRNGDRILFGSNWREGITDPSNVDTYVVDWRP